MPLDADELADLRADMTAEMLTETAKVQRKTTTDNGGGRQGASWTDGATYPCRMWTKPTYRDMAEAVQPGAQRLASSVIWTVLLPVEADVKAADRLIIGGQTLEVTERDKGRTDAITMQAFCKRIS